jgi:hypothetical protein
VISCPGGQKIELPFGVSRHSAPALLVAVYRFDRGSEQLGHLGLCLVEFFPKLSKFFAFQRGASLVCLKACPSSVARPDFVEEVEAGILSSGVRLRRSSISIKSDDLVKSSTYG